MQIHQGSVAREDHPSLSLTPLHGLPLTLASRLCYGRARILTQSSNARVVWMMLSSPQASKPPSSVQGSSWFPRQSLHFSPHLPMSRPKNMVRRWPVRRVNETQALGDAPQVPISSYPRFRRVLTRHQSQIRAPSLRCLVTLEAENDR